MTSEKEAIDAHAVILELYNICDGVLLSVIPQLELELKVMMVGNGTRLARGQYCHHDTPNSIRLNS